MEVLLRSGLWQIELLEFLVVERWGTGDIMRVGGVEVFMEN